LILVGQQSWCRGERGLIVSVEDKIAAVEEEEEESWRSDWGTASVSGMGVGLGLEMAAAMREFGSRTGQAAWKDGFIIGCTQVLGFAIKALPKQQFLNLLPLQRGQERELDVSGRNGGMSRGLIDY
jgi:hypothetical protein